MVADSSAAASEVADSAWDELEARVKAHRFTRNKFRTNLGGATMRYGPKRKIFLFDGHLSNTFREGPILKLVRSTHQLGLL